MLARRINPEELPPSRRPGWRGGAVTTRHAAPRGASRSAPVRAAGESATPREGGLPDSNPRASTPAPNLAAPSARRASSPEEEARQRSGASRRPSVGPGGQVQWWERPAPGDDEELWRAVVRCHEALQRRGWTVTGLARRLARRGHPVRRETLSRVLNGQQRTSWETVEAIAEALDVEL